MTAKRLLTITAAGLAVLTLSAACGNDKPGTAAKKTTAAPVIDVKDGGNYRPVIDPANFVDTIDNPYFPLTPGSRWVYEGRDGEETEHIEVTVQPDRRTVLGIPAVVVRDTVTVEGQVKEDTWDWYAQDRDGNVWYLGEDTKEYENGKVSSTHGSWEAGKRGALPGIVMQAQRVVGKAYRQEYQKGEAEDAAQILRLDGSTTVPAGRFDKLVVTKEWNPLEADVVEEKSYAPGVGVVLETKVAGGTGRIELIEFTPGQPGVSPTGA